MENELWRYMEDQLQGVLMFYQKKQLFKDSIGSDDMKLGYYSNESRSKGRDLTRGEKRKNRNQEFTMIDSGDFFDKMEVIVDKSAKEITFTSNTSHLAEMLTNQFFETHNFFGLTRLNVTHLINLHLKEHMKEWTRIQLTKKR